MSETTITLPFGALTAWITGKPSHFTCCSFSESSSHESEVRSLGVICFSPIFNGFSPSCQASRLGEPALSGRTCISCYARFELSISPWRDQLLASPPSLDSCLRSWGKPSSLFWFWSLKVRGPPVLVNQNPIIGHPDDFL